MRICRWAGSGVRKWRLSCRKAFPPPDAVLRCARMQATAPSRRMWTRSCAHGWRPMSAGAGNAYRLAAAPWSSCAAVARISSMPSR